MEKTEPTREELHERIRSLEERLWEAEETLQAIRSGEVDALVTEGPGGMQLYTLTGADQGYRILVESINEGALILSSDDSIYYCNSALREMLGAPAGTIVGRRLDSFCPASFRTQLVELIGESRSSGAARGECMMNRNDGTLLPVKISLNHLNTEYFEGVCGVVTDLSQQKRTEEELKRHRTELQSLVDERTAELQREVAERKLAEEGLRQSEERFRLFMDNSPAIAWVKDDQGRHHYLNRTYETRFGVRLDDWRGKTDAELWPPEIAEEFLGNDLAVLSTERPVEVIEKTINPDGTTCYWLNTKFFYAAPDGIRFVAGIGIDITARKHAEEALKESEERLRLALDAAKAGTWEWDLRTNDNSWSEELFRLYGLEPHGCKPSYESWGETVHPEDRERAEQTVQEAATTGTELHAEWRVRSQDGAERWLMSRGRPLCDALGKPVRYIGIVIDITERKRSEIELNKSLRENVALLKEIHHRVKNNLQVVVSLLGLQAGTIKNRELQGILEDTRNRVRSMALLHEALYRSGDFANIKFGTYINTLCQQIVTSHGQLARLVKVERRLSDIELSLEQAVPCALIVNELVSNALKHAFPNNRPGAVVVTFERVDEQSVRLCVQDDGVGIPPGIDPSSSPTLGLLLVSELTGQLLGHLTLERPGEGGTVFRVSFPTLANGYQRGAR